MLLHFTSSSYCAQVCNFHLWNIWILCKHFTHNNSTKGRVWTSTELGNNISQTKFVCLFSFNVSPWESLLDFSWVLHNTNVHDFENVKSKDYQKTIVLRLPCIMLTSVFEKNCVTNILWCPVRTVLKWYVL